MFPGSANILFELSSFQKRKAIHLKQKRSYIVLNLEYLRQKQ